VVLQAPAEGQTLAAGDPFAELAQQISTTDPRSPHRRRPFSRARTLGTSLRPRAFHDQGRSWPNHQPLARFMAGDDSGGVRQPRQTVTIASADPGEVERARHDLEQDPALHPLATPDPTAMPADVDVLMDDATYESQRAARQRIHPRW